MTNSTPPISPLVAELITASLTRTQQVTNQVIENLEAMNADLRAELSAVREEVLALLDGRYMPMPEAIRRALYPSRAAIASRREVEER